MVTQSDHTRFQANKILDVTVQSAKVRKSEDAKRNDDVISRHSASPIITSDTGDVERNDDVTSKHPATPKITPYTGTSIVTMTHP